MSAVLALKEHIRRELVQSDLEFREPKNPKWKNFSLKNHGVHLILHFHWEGQVMFPWFQPIKGLAKCCDYAVIREREGTLEVLLMELKSNELKGAVEQIRSGVLVCEYLVRNVFRVAPQSCPPMRFRGLVVSKTHGQALPHPDDKLPFKSQKVLGTELGYMYLAPPNGQHLSRFWL